MYTYTVHVHDMYMYMYTVRHDYTLETKIGELTKGH